MDLMSHRMRGKYMHQLIRRNVFKAHKEWYLIATTTEDATLLAIVLTISVGTFSGTLSTKLCKLLFY